MRHLDVSDTGMTAAICGRGAVFCLYIDNRLPVKARAIFFLKACKETRSFKDVMNCLFFLPFGHTNICVIMIDIKDINRLTYGSTSVYNLNYHLI